MKFALFSVIAAAAAMFAPAVADAQSSRGGIRSFGHESPESAAKILSDFRNYRIGDYCFEFVIKHVPRRSDDTKTYHGTIWTTWGGDGPLFRVELQDAAPAAGAAAGGTGDAKTAAAAVRFILKSGPSSALWTLGADGRPALVTGNVNKPFFPGLIITPLELQTPFSYWADSRYIKTDRFRGRPTHFFEMRPPADFLRANPQIGSVRLGFDRAYNALMQAVVLNPAGDETRKLEAESFTKVRDVYIPEELRVLDLVKRDKDIMRVTAAAVRLRNPREVFDPATLDRPARKPLPEFFVKVE
ncbi:MAG: hypothetical protein LBR07_04615 [Puniceicoccales bacterium]|jgi:hypothetical protein|nr:hypothetical protein [Puniceicoccales bacterium]